MPDLLKFSVPGKAEYVGTIRMAVSCLANTAGLDVEAIEDVKVAVSEACSNAVRHGRNNNGFEYEVCCELEEDRFIVSVTDKCGGFDVNRYKEPSFGCAKEGGLGIYVIKALMDEVDIYTEIGVGTRIKMVKYTR